MNIYNILIPVLFISLHRQGRKNMINAEAYLAGITPPSVISDAKIGDNWCVVLRFSLCIILCLLGVLCFLFVFLFLYISKIYNSNARNIIGCLHVVF